MTWGVLVTGLGYLTGAIVFLMAARGKRLATEGMGWLALVGFCGGILGARIAEWTLGHGAELASNPTLALDPRFGGRTILGGVIGGWLAVEIVKRRLGIRRSTGDLFALALPAGEAVGRIGCLLNGCCYGVTCNLPWAIHQHSEWRHPTQVYLSLSAALIFGILLTLRDRLKREGDLFRLYLVFFGLSRFVIEFFREHPAGFGGLSLAQWACLEIGVIGFIGLGRSHTRLKAVTQERG